MEHTRMDGESMGVVNISNRDCRQKKQYGLHAGWTSNMATLVFALPEMTEDICSLMYLCEVNPAYLTEDSGLLHAGCS